MGLVLPTRMRPFVTTDLFSPLEKLRMGLDLVLPRDGLERDIAVGTFLRRRLGDALVERLAGPLIGGVYGTPVDELSLLAVVPQLRDAEREHRSLLLASLASGRARKGQPGGSPFVTLAGGTGQLTDALVAAIEAMSDVTVRTGRGASSAPPCTGRLRRPARRRRSETRFEAVVLATPGPAAADLLDGIAPVAAERIGTIPHGSTAVVTLAYALDAFTEPPTGHGFLVAAGEPLAIDACTFSSRKWAGRAPDGTILLRCFVGSRRPEVLAGDGRGDPGRGSARPRDDASGRAANRSLGRSPAGPGRCRTTRSGTSSGSRRVSEALADLPGLILAGAPYRGVGLPDCISQGRAAAASVEGVLGGLRADGRRPTETRAMTPGASPDPDPAHVSVPLHRIAPGSGGRVASVGAAHRAELAREGVRPGADLSVSAAAPFDGPLVLRIGRARVALARSVAATVNVTPRAGSPGSDDDPPSTVR